MSRLIDLTGKQFGEWNVIRYAGDKKWECRCSCGKIKNVASARLKDGGSKSCGHEKSNFIDLTGAIFGDWEVLEYVGNRLWKCRCSCGVVKLVSGYELRIGASKSCGHSANKIVDITGQVFGEWTVLEHDKDSLWKCQCSCGIIKSVDRRSLQDGRSKSCGHSTTGFKDLTGQTFDEWTVICRDTNSDSVKWICQCSCGELAYKTTYELTHHSSKSCGHNSSKFKDILGKTFGELTVKEYLGNQKWKCLCSCGNLIEATGYSLRSGNKTSCGCKTNRAEMLKGKTFGEWEVLDDLGDKYRLCRCSCGKLGKVTGYALKSGKSKSCGHLDPPNKIDLTGQILGELEVLSYIGDGKWNCLCSCGNSVVKSSRFLRNSARPSCGCQTISMIKESILNKFGDPSSRKADKPRDDWQIEALHNKDLMTSIIINFIISEERKPTIEELSNILDINRANMGKAIKELGLRESIDYNPSTIIEDEVYNFINSICTINDIDVQRHNREVLSGLELDIYIPNLKLAIEINGDYWHSDIYKSKDYHINKTKACENQGIHLIHIFEYEWNNANTQEKIKNLLRNRLSSVNNLVYARNCKIELIDSTKANEFHQKYHLQNETKSDINIGILYNSELVSVMSFGYTRFTDKYDFEILRYTIRNDIAIVGGAERLLKYFLTNYNPKSIVSYCDLSKFTGQVYRRLGMHLDGITPPSYVWVKAGSNEVLTRYQTQKHTLIKNGLGNENQTEEDIMRNLGYLKVYNCGNARFIWNKS